VISPLSAKAARGRIRSTFEAPLEELLPVFGRDAHAHVRGWADEGRFEVMLVGRTEEWPRDGRSPCLSGDLTPLGAWSLLAGEVLEQPQPALFRRLARILRVPATILFGWASIVLVANPPREEEQGIPFLVTGAVTVLAWLAPPVIDWRGESNARAVTRWVAGVLEADSVELILGPASRLQRLVRRIGGAAG